MRLTASLFPFFNGEEVTTPKSHLSRFFSLILPMRPRASVFSLTVRWNLNFVLDTATDSWMICWQALRLMDGLGITHAPFKQEARQAGYT